jgi:lipopolysaccharide export system permease protein
MKNLIFRKFAKDTSVFFILMCFIVGLIVWTLQAVNYFDYVVQDGHGLGTYFGYIVSNFPKIIHRIVPFIFFISLFYILNDYEMRNELLIYWTSGVSKFTFANKIIVLSIILTIFQIGIGSFFSPLSQYKGREFLKNSNIDFFTSLIKDGKFINAVDGLTIFIKNKNNDGTFSNIFIDDASKKVSKMIYAKDGIIVENEKIKIFKLFQGQVINQNDKKINIFKFDQVDFNLSDYSANTILVPKLQEMPSLILLNCSLKFFKKIQVYNEYNFKCKKSINHEINQELFKRFYKPLYIPLIAIMCCFLIIAPKNNIFYKRNRKIIFFLTFLIIILSEASLRYSTSSNFNSFIYLILPWVGFIIVYTIFYYKTKNA